MADNGDKKDSGKPDDLDPDGDVSESEAQDAWGRCVGM